MCVPVWTKRCKKWKVVEEEEKESASENWWRINSSQNMSTVNSRKASYSLLPTI
jgi:predicted acetyltransferase